MSSYKGEDSNSLLLKEDDWNTRGRKGSLIIRPLIGDDPALDMLSTKGSHLYEESRVDNEEEDVVKMAQGKVGEGLGKVVGEGVGEGLYVSFLEAGVKKEERILSSIPPPTSLSDPTLLDSPLDITHETHESHEEEEEEEEEEDWMSRREKKHRVVSTPAERARRMSLMSPFGREEALGAMSQDERGATLAAMSAEERAMNIKSMNAEEAVATLVEIPDLEAREP